MVDLDKPETPEEYRKRTTPYRNPKGQTYTEWLDLVRLHNPGVEANGSSLLAWHRGADPTQYKETP